MLPLQSRLERAKTGPGLRLVKTQETVNPHDVDASPAFKTLGETDQHDNTQRIGPGAASPRSRAVLVALVL